MKPLDDLSLDDLGRIEIVLCDIDDTITTAGRLTAAAYDGLERLQEAGVRVIPITGRPAGWCDHIARMWPVDGIVGENGAVSMVYDRTRRRMRRHLCVDPERMRANRTRLDRLAEEILAAVPGAGLASDQPYRLADLAIDFCEDVDPLPEAAIDRIVALFKDAGAQAKVSSIHVNGWFGDYDKLSMTRMLLEREFGLSVAQDAGRILFVGDSPNDEPMFAAFPLSVGVANIRDFSHRLKTTPSYVTLGRSGDGFVELVDRIVAARGR